MCGFFPIASYIWRVLYRRFYCIWSVLVVVQVKYKYKVIIMELCTGGSLYEVIDSPENAYGLDEPQFKQLIYDVGQLLLGGLLIFLSHLDFGEYHPFPQL